MAKYPHLWAYAPIIGLHVHLEAHVPKKSQTNKTKKNAIILYDRKERNVLIVLVQPPLS